MSSKSPLGDAFLAFVLAAVAGCERSVPQKPAVSAPIVPTTAAPSAVPAPSASTSESRTIRRYWKRVDVPSDTEWWAMVLDDRTLVLLSPELARVLPVTDVVTSANGTTFNVRSRDGIVPCTIEATEAEE
ncbi:MAG TPA: hypothetical protein VF103_14660, partial [Polyangiaceae bacterium]